MLRHTITERRGFTLVSLAITAAISAYVIISTLMVFISSMSLNEVTRNQVTAFNDAQWTMEEISRLTFAQIDNFVPAKLANLPGENIAFARANINSDIKRVTVTVTWNEKNRNRTYQLSTQFTR